MKRRLFNLAAAVSLVMANAVLCVSCCSHVITDQEMTAGAIGETSYRIGMYVNSNGKPPPDLSVLPARPGYVNRTTDGWNRPLVYRVDADAFSLTSLGRDGVVGGSGEDADVVRKYRVLDGRVTQVKE
jgi:hypothetical protein